MWQQLLEQISKGDIKALARCVSFVENEQEGYEQLMSRLPLNTHSKITGITGPPGAGKSTLVDGLIREMIQDGHKVAVICIDPSSPFHLGAVLGDRIRMSQWYTHPDVFIRSMATRGAMGGLHPKIIEVTELMKAAGFHHILVETVGVGQSEIDIVGLADTTVVVVVPEAGDEVQTMKAGLMEIADVFVVNKSDRPDADAFVKNLRLMLAPSFTTHHKEIAIIKTVAHENKGIKELYEAIIHHEEEGLNEKKLWLMTEKVFQLVQKGRMKHVDKVNLKNAIVQQIQEGTFNLYRMVEHYL